MPPKVLGPRKQKFYKWTDNITIEFLNICREYQKNNGESQPFAWVEIAQAMVDKFGKPCDQHCVKNKFRHMKELWSIWRTLRQGETGLGWDAEKCRIVADSAWWERKCKENPKYKTFRNKGIPTEISDLWDEIFNNTVATGKYCVVPGMDVEGPGGEEENELNDEVLREDDDVYGFDEGYNDLMHLNLEVPDEDLLNNVYMKVTQTQGESSKLDNPPLKKTKVSKGSTQTPTTRKKRTSKGATVFAEGFAMIEKNSERMMTMLEGEIGSPGSCATKRRFTYDDSLEFIDRMVNEGSLVEGEPLWCFAIDAMMTYETRNCFMTLDKDSSKLSWLKWKFGCLGKC